MRRDTSGCGVSYLRAGEGSPLIFIHGWAMAASVWKRQIDYFSGRGFEVTAPDLRGHGDSIKEGPYTISQMAFDLKSFVHEMAYERPVLVGWSMGAMVLLDYIAKHPRSAAGICLVGGTPRFTSSGDFPHGLARKDVMGMKSKLKRDFMRSIMEFRGTIAGEIPDAGKSIITDASAPSPDAVKRGLDELMNADLRNGLEKINIPALLIHGDMDKVCPCGASKYMAERIEGAELFIMEGAGHVPFLFDAKQFNGKLEEFAGRVL